MCRISYQIGFSSRRCWHLLEEVQRQNLLDFAHDALDVLLGISVEVVGVWPANAEG
jgi:hypothetical protein